MVVKMFKLFNCFVTHTLCKYNKKVGSATSGISINGQKTVKFGIKKTVAR